MGRKASQGKKFCKIAATTEKVPRTDILCSSVNKGAQRKAFSDYLNLIEGYMKEAFPSEKQGPSHVD